MIAYRDAWLLVVDKPSGLPTQPTRAGGDSVLTRLEASERYVGLHHRIDQPASGLVLFTVDPDANAAVTRALRRHEIRRRYLAVLYGIASDGTWDRPVQNKRARSEVRVLGSRAGLSAVELALDTGRKHQLRVHAALAGTPICGDRRYGGEAGRRWPRLALHAHALELTHPVTGAPLAIRSALPLDLTELWSVAGGPPRVERAGEPPPRS